MTFGAAGTCAIALRNLSTSSRVTTGCNLSSGVNECCSTTFFSSSSEGYSTTTLKRNRSSCASGSGYVPSCSIGFWVAMTRKLEPSRWVRPSMVTVRSCIACSSAACVLGGVRLISSASSSSVKTGPLLRTNWLVWKLNRLVPMTSPGIRSGVNWMRLKERRSAAAKLRAMSVFAVPGTPSRSTCPSDSSAASSRSTTASCPTTTRRTCSRTPWQTARTSFGSMQHPRPPQVNAPRRLHQRGGRAGRAPHLATQRFDPRNADARGHPIQPCVERAPAQLAGRVEGSGHFLQGAAQVAIQRMGGVSAEAQQLRHAVDQRRFSRGERRIGGQRRPEAAHAAPQQEAAREERLQDGEREREAQQGAPGPLVVRAAVERLVETDRATLAEALDQRDRQAGVVAAPQPVVGEQVGVGEHQQLPAGGRSLPDEQPAVGGEDGLQVLADHQLRGAQ